MCTTFVKSEDTTKLGGTAGCEEDGKVTEKEPELSDIWLGNTQLKFKARQKLKKNTSICIKQKGNAEELGMRGDESWLDNNF